MVGGARGLTPDILSYALRAPADAGFEIGPGDFVNLLFGSIVSHPKKVSFL